MIPPPPPPPLPSPHPLHPCHLPPTLPPCHLPTPLPSPHPCHLQTRCRPLGEPPPPSPTGARTPGPSMTSLGKQGRPWRPTWWLQRLRRSLAGGVGMDQGSCTGSHFSPHLWAKYRAETKHRRNEASESAAKEGRTGLGCHCGACVGGKSSLNCMGRCVRWWGRKRGRGAAMVVT